jgi:O-acetyl-ADP-ribose deacetylase (regulator of RNase III)
MIAYVEGDIFDSPAQTLVNPVNTVGVMGSGLALEFKRRHPAMFLRYAEVCRDGRLQLGQLLLYRGADRWILSFPTKQHWKDPSRLEWIEAGLRKFVNTYRSKGIESAAFPMLGCGHGGLRWADVGPLMQRVLEPLPIPISIHGTSPVSSCVRGP